MQKRPRAISPTRDRPDIPRGWATALTRSPSRGLPTDQWSRLTPGRRRLSESDSASGARPSLSHTVTAAQPCMTQTPPVRRWTFLACFCRSESVFCRRARASRFRGQAHRDTRMRRAECVSSASESESRLTRIRRPPVRPAATGATLSTPDLGATLVRDLGSPGRARRLT